MVNVVELLTFGPMADKLRAVLPQILHEQFLRILYACFNCLQLLHLQALVKLYCVRSA